MELVGLAIKCLPKYGEGRWNSGMAGGSSFRARASAASSSANLQISNVKTQKSEKTVRVGILGASGYTGAEIVRLLANHSHFDITVLTAERKAGQPFGSVFPHFITQNLPDTVAIKDADFSNVDAVFCCLPHGTTQEIIKGLPNELKIVDLSADFRLHNIREYEDWYGLPHKAPQLQTEAVYGLTEVYRDEIRASSGAGRGAKEANLYTEVAEDVHSYGITNHRHVPEIEQGLSEAANSTVTISFSPHSMPMSRGMQSTIYVKMVPGVTVDDLYQHLKSIYEGEEFVKVLEKGKIPHTKHVRGSNYCFMNVYPDRILGRAIIISVLDNLVKGASGQAIQNMNIMMGFPENTSLGYQSLFP